MANERSTKEYTQGHMVLIHGAWQGSWSWEQLLPHLRLRGWHTHAVDLPGNGRDDTPPEEVSLALYVDYLQQLLDKIGEPVVVVAHSGGGVVASQLAEARPGQISALVYVAGMMLPDGVGFASLVREYSAVRPDTLGIGPHLEWSGDRMSSRVPEDAARNIFFHDCPIALAGAAVKRLSPQSERGRAIAPRLTEENYGRVPRIYVETSKDRSVVPRLQRRMQGLCPGARRLSIDTGHVPQLVEPALLAQLIANELGALQKASPANCGKPAIPCAPG
jgi:pimeloyl-ACP methyl ester carboxylesterase